MFTTAFKKRIRSVSLIFACGTALFSDGYANGVIGTVNTLLTRVYGKEVLAVHNRSTTLTSLAFAGTVVGMVLFGYISDKVGRKFGMMSATTIVILFSGLSAASSGTNGSIGGMLNMLSAMRFLLGIGIGAEYPCGSVSASEQSEEPGINKKAQHRWLVLATNTMITSGFVLASFVPLVLFWIFGNDHLRAVWRISLGFGMIPAFVVFIWRLNMDEPVPYKRDSMKYTRIPYRLVIRRYWKFLFDMIVYPFGLFSSTIINNITGGSKDLAVVFGWNVVINLFHIPGTVAGAFIIDHIGPRTTMITALVVQAIIGFIMSALYKKLTEHIAAFAVVYGIFLTLGGFGPGNCTIVFASKTSSTGVRGQFYGIAAAVGKVGAFVGTWIFPALIDAFGGSDTIRGNTGPFWIGSGIAALNALVTFFFVKPLAHDGMILEDRLFREYLEENGYDTSQMGLGEESSITSIEGENMSQEEKTAV